MLRYCFIFVLMSNKEKNLLVIFGIIFVIVLIIFNYHKAVDSTQQIKRNLPSVPLQELPPDNFAQDSVNNGDHSSSN